MQKYEQVTASRKDIIINNFIGGISWALGATIGLSIILGILGFIASKINVTPIIGDVVSHTIDYVLKNNSHFR